MNLANISKMIADYEPPPDPFNGATRVFLSADAYAAIVPHVLPLDRRRIAFEQRAMAPGYGLGFRPSRDGDDPDAVVDGYGTLVWTLAPRTP